MRVSLIITAYNRPDALARVLRTVNIQSRCPDEIIIADDGSDNLTKKCIVDFQTTSSIRLIHSWQEDKGFRVAKSRNKAIAKSNYEYIILIDGDVLLHEKFIEDHLNHSESGFFVQGPRVFLNKEKTENILNSDNTNISFFSKGISNRKNSIHSVFLAKTFSKNKNVLGGIKTCNLAFHKSDAIAVNGFNNDIEGWGREDTEFIVRLFNNGIKRKTVRFNMIQFHLWHQNFSRESLKKNNLILNFSIKEKSTWCENGIDKYL
jgi:glycosyltransferase involved in cell wall biosynthesis